MLQIQRDGAKNRRIIADRRGRGREGMNTRKIDGFIERETLVVARASVGGETTIFAYAFDAKSMHIAPSKIDCCR